MKSCIALGQTNIYKIDSNIFTENCIIVLECNDKEEGIKKAYEIFGNKLCFEYFEKCFKRNKIKIFPKGFIL